MNSTMLQYWYAQERMCDMQAFAARRSRLRSLRHRAAVRRNGGNPA